MKIKAIDKTLLLLLTYQKITYGKLCRHTFHQ